MTRETNWHPEKGDSDAEVPSGGLSGVPQYVSVPDSESGSRNRFEINLFELGHLLVRRRKWFFAIVIPVVLLTALVMFTTPNVYQSKAIILPSRVKAKMSTIGELVGLGSGMGSADENSSVLYPLILQSNLIKDSVLSRVYDVKFKGKSIRVVPSEYFGKTDPNKLRKCLGDATTATASKRTGEVYMSVETEYPELSQAILAAYLEQLDNYNRFSRKSSAKENQRYLEERLVGAGQELEQAEDDLRSFRNANSNWAATTNADILRDLLRLERNLQIKSTTYLFLQKQLETAKFDAQKDIPIVRVLDQPSLPTIKSGPRRIITIFFSGVISFAIVLIGIFLYDLWRQGIGGSNQESYGALRRNVTQAFPRSTRILNLIRRVRAPQFVRSRHKVGV